jgi:hypothetical protein
MSKATSADVIGLGFKLDMFRNLDELGENATQEQFESWIQAKLDKATRYVLSKVPVGIYDDPLKVDKVIEIESNLAGAEMARIKRMLQSEDQDTMSLGPIGGLGNSGRTFQAFGQLATELENRALLLLKELIPPASRPGPIIAR